MKILKCFWTFVLYIVYFVSIKVIVKYLFKKNTVLLYLKY